MSNSVPQKTQPGALYKTADQSSQSNPQEVVTTRLELNWDIDFEQQCIIGWAEHTLKVISAEAEYAHFDSIHLELQQEVLINGSEKCNIVYSAPPHSVLGTRLSIPIPTSCRSPESQFTVRFYYTVTRNASALQWLPAAATKGQKYPYCFTQSQAIHARSLFPCMDSPGVKAPYFATVTAPKWCTVLMSALQEIVDISSSSSTSPIGNSIDESKNVFVWKQPVPTPAYLVALAAGNLASREISDRVRVWSEPEVVDSAHYEFAETEEFLKAAEDLTGCPYQWTRYDILCLPPSFPYGGMENPCLTFATPTLLAGDRSLADVIAHEIAHSWTGNLVTNVSWDHFWLNEGWTVWLERKITSRVRHSDEHGKLSSQIGWKHVQDDIELLGATNPSTRLVWDLQFGEDPDDAYSAVPYEKGCNLLQYLERIVGTSNFDGFVKSYIQKFKFGTVTTGEFRDHFVSHFAALAASQLAAENAESQNSSNGNNNSKSKRKKGKTNSTAAAAATSAAVAGVQQWSSAIQQLQWDELFFTEGVPSYCPDFANSLSKHAESLAFMWIAYASSGHKNNISDPAVADFQTWSAQQKNVFLETLLNHVKGHELPAAEVFTAAFLRELDTTYRLSDSKNSEIMLRWQTLCLLSECDFIVPFVLDFITSQGRMKFVRPLYRALRASDIGRELAVQTFEQHKDMYHPIAKKMLASDLKRAAQQEAELTSSTADAAVADKDEEEDDRDEEMIGSEAAAAVAMVEAATSVITATVSTVASSVAAVAAAATSAPLASAEVDDSTSAADSKTDDSNQEAQEQKQSIATESPASSPVGPSATTAAVEAAPVAAAVPAADTGAAPAASTSSTTSSAASSSTTATSRMSWDRIVPSPKRSTAAAAGSSWLLPAGLLAAGAVASIAAFYYLRLRRK